MQLHTRKLLDRAFSSFGMIAILLMALALVFILYPIITRGVGAYVFRGTVEFREALYELYGVGCGDSLAREVEKAELARKPVYDYIAEFKSYLDELSGEAEFEAALSIAHEWAEVPGMAGRSIARTLRGYQGTLSAEEKMALLDRVAARAQRASEPEIAGRLDDFLAACEVLRARDHTEDEDLREQLLAWQSRLDAFERALQRLLGPPPGAPVPILMRDRYGQQRWDRTQVRLNEVLFSSEWIFDERGHGERVLTPRADDFEGTALAPVFEYIESHIEELMRPRLTVYWRFLFLEARDAYFFGGIWPAVLGTFYLTLGAMLIAVPFGVLAATYLCEYARPCLPISLLRSCISTLAGVPSIVFGLFGLAFFLNTLQVSQSKSVLAGSLTLSLMVLPTIIRASEEAIRAVPQTFKEAALALGATRWRTVTSVILPAALPGILTGIVISMGRAAGETAPIIFTAAVSVGRIPALRQVFSHPTQALPWNIYNLSTEHEAVDEIRHVQFGMVFTLVLLVLLLNMLAICTRARMSKKMRG